jgi:hypothetical protein
VSSATTRLALAWLNATVVKRGATAARTQELVHHRSVHTQDAMAVPKVASRISVIWATTYQRPTTWTSPSVIEQTLAALRAPPSVGVAAAGAIPGYLGSIVGNGS